MRFQWVGVTLKGNDNYRNSNYLWRDRFLFWPAFFKLANVSLFLTLQVRQLNEGRRAYVPVEIHKCQAINDCLKKVYESMRDVEGWTHLFRESERTSANALFGFRAHARFGATLNELIRSEHVKSPYDLLQLLKSADPDLARELLLKF